MTSACPAPLSLLRLSPRVCSDSCPVSWWCYPTISSSATHFAFNLSKHQGLFPGIYHFASGGQSIRASVSASVFLMNIQGWCPWGLTGLISLQSKSLSLLQHHTIQKYQYFSVQSSLWYNSNLYITTGKTIVLTIRAFISKVVSLLFNVRSRFVIAFLPRSKHLLFHGCSHHLHWFWNPSN